MRQSELGFAPLSGASWQEVQRVVAPRAERGAGFASLMHQVREEVADFISYGSQEFPRMASDLSPEARARLLRQPASANVAESPAMSTAQQNFLSGIAPYATKAARRLGVSADVLAAHAALESGWGQQPLRHEDGRDTHNLFAIKAGSGWSGDFAAVGTTEYEQNVAIKKVERFRSYADYAAAFSDFAQLLMDKPRYHSALNTGSDVGAYAQALVRGGYATDPDYANKLVQVAARIQSGR